MHLDLLIFGILQIQALSVVSKPVLIKFIGREVRFKISSLENVQVIA